jgi:hypothetical protein
MHTPPPSSAGCSNEPLFALLTGDCQQQLSFSISAPAVVFDWSTFPVVEQGYKFKEEPVPFLAPSSAPAHYFTSCSSATSCRPTFDWEVEDEDSSSEGSVSSDEDELSSVSASVEPVQETRRQTHKKSVSFSSCLEIRQHDVILGDHPCCSALALSLGSSFSEEVVDFDLYESARQFQRRRKGTSELRLTYRERLSLLEDSMGKSETELLIEEQRMWREENFPTETKQTDKPPSLPQHRCSREETASQQSIMRKIPSTNQLPALAV